MYVYMCIYIGFRVYIHIHTYIHTYIRMYNTYIHTYVCPIGLSYIGFVSFGLTGPIGVSYFVQGFDSFVFDSLVFGSF